MKISNLWRRKNFRVPSYLRSCASLRPGGYNNKHLKYTVWDNKAPGQCYFSKMLFQVTSTLGVMFMSQKYSIRVVNICIIMIKSLFIIHTRYCKYRFHYIIVCLRLQKKMTHFCEHEQNEVELKNAKMWTVTEWTVGECGLTMRHLVRLRQFTGSVNIFFNQLIAKLSTVKPAIPALLKRQIYGNIIYMSLPVFMSCSHGPVILVCLIRRRNMKLRFSFVSSDLSGRSGVPLTLAHNAR